MAFTLHQSFAVVALSLTLSAFAQTSGVTTRYWDCCKPSCAWTGKASVNQPVQTCDAAGSKLTDAGAASGCDGGGAFACTDNQPFAVSDTLAYGFAAVNLADSSETAWCCECYELSFTSGPVAGQKMIVQATNTGGDVGSNQFDLLIPGGGVGIFNGCAAQFGSWEGGAQYGGVSNSTQCDQLPESVRAGCKFRFDWFKGADNPTMTFQKTTCPSELVAKSGCKRDDAAGETTLTSTMSPPSTTQASNTTSTASSTSDTSSTSTEPVTTTPEPVTTSSEPAATTSAPATTGAVPRYSQCGGQGFAGSTNCAAPYACTYVNDYYSQCL